MQAKTLRQNHLKGLGTEWRPRCNKNLTDMLTGIPTGPTPQLRQTNVALHLQLGAALCGVDRTCDRHQSLECQPAGHHETAMLARWDCTF